MASVLGHAELMPIGEPGQLFGELFAFERRQFHRNRETAGEVSPHDPLDAPDLAEIGHDRLPKTCALRCGKGYAAGRDVDRDAGKLAAVLEHEFSAKANLHPAVPPSLGDARFRRIRRSRRGHVHLLLRARWTRQRAQRQNDKDEHDAKIFAPLLTSAYFAQRRLAAEFDCTRDGTRHGAASIADRCEGITLRNGKLGSGPRGTLPAAALLVRHRASIDARRRLKVRICACSISPRRSPCARASPCFSFPASSSLWRAR